MTADMRDPGADDRAPLVGRYFRISRRAKITVDKAALPPPTHLGGIGLPIVVPTNGFILYHRFL